MVSDAALVEASIRGDSVAFGVIVDRYKTLVCSITYSGTGNLSLSEELAQETFLTAWRKLDTLAEWGRLRAWLCGIARNVTRARMREERREPAAGAEALGAAEGVSAAERTPAERAISQETQEVLWRALERIPQTYREPMVLFYREQQSVRTVAEQLELSEDAVKQRLSRGRAKLKAEMAAFVEETLGRTVPGRVFTAGVVAALSAGTAQKAAAATVAVVVGKGACGAGAGAISAVLAPLIGILGGVYGAWNDYRQAESPEERRLVVIITTIIFAYVVLFLALFPMIDIDWVSNGSALKYSALLGGWIGLLIGGLSIISGTGMSRIRRARMKAQGLDPRQHAMPTLVANDWKAASGQSAPSPLRTALAVAAGLVLLATLIGGWIAVEYDVIDLSALRTPAGRLWLLGGFIPATLLLAGILVALWVGTNTKYSAGARKLHAGWTLAIFVLVAVYLAVKAFLPSDGGMSNLSNLAYVAGLLALILWFNWRVQKLQHAGQLYAGDGQAPAPPALGQPIRLGRGTALANSYGVFAGAICWMAVIALLVRDWLTAAALAAAIVVVPVAMLKLFSPRYWRIVLADMAVAVFLSLSVVNLRWNAWMVHYRMSRFYEPINDQPRWVMNLLLGALFAAFIVACAFKDRRGRKDMETTDEEETEQ